VGRLVVVSFRLGGVDGVSIEANKWIDALRLLGHDVTTLAGEGDADVIIQGFAIGATTAPSHNDVQTALHGADLVIVENLVSLPLNVAARDVLYQALEGRRALFRHHDLASQRAQFHDADAPRDEKLWRHVTINDLSRQELARHGIHAIMMRNSFDCDPPLGRRDDTRRALGIENERLVVMPTRAIRRKNVEGAIALTTTLEATLWLLGPAEDGYAPILETLINDAGVPILRGLPEGFNVHDAYAASDLVTMPSTWEGFGNPVLESVTHRRPLAVYPYPVLEEIRSFGFHFFALDDTVALRAFLENPDEGLFVHNLELARQHFNVATLGSRLAALLASMNVK
jgi:glycosyltransferase involved in cell wall biosynthesis